MSNGTKQAAPEVGTALAPPERGGLAARTATAASILDVISQAIDKGISVESLERLQLMYERERAQQAAMEFAAAMAAFQMACPPIAKRSRAQIDSRSGVKFAYNYAELDEIARTVRPLLHSRGLSYAWDSTVTGGIMTVVCTVRHVNGHHITASFACPTENAAGMSPQQKAAAALTFARRQSLIQALGITTAEPDTDGANPEPITADQAQDLQALLEETGGNLARFLKWAKVQRIADVLARDYESCVNVIRSAAREREAKKGGAS
jgi:hypothetical protein